MAFVSLTLESGELVSVASTQVEAVNQDPAAEDSRAVVVLVSGRELRVLGARAAVAALLDAAEAVSIATLAGTAAVMADADAGRTIRCTNPATVAITVDAGLLAGTTVEYVQEGTGQVQVSAGVGVTLLVAASFLARTAERYSSLVVTVLDATTALVRGDLEAA